MHLGDSIFILILALVLLGPRKTSELAGKLGKLMGEFRKASNDFKFQFNEEMRVADQQDQQKKQETERAALGAGAVSEAGTPIASENIILPPAPADSVPYAISATTGEEHSTEDHPLLRVDAIPPLDGPPLVDLTDFHHAESDRAEFDQPEEGPSHNGAHSAGHIVQSVAEPAAEHAEDGAPIHHG